MSAPDVLRVSQVIGLVANPNGSNLTMSVRFERALAVGFAVSIAGAWQNLQSRN